MQQDDDDNRPVPQLGSLTAPPERPDLKKRIMESKQKLLNNIKGKFTGEETGRWLDNIDQSPTRADETIGPGSLIDESQLSMPAFIDMLFDHLQRYVFEYNKIPSNQDNILNCERPHGYQEKAEYGAQSTRVKFMRGHLSSRTWSMVVNAMDEEIALYVVPTEFLMGFDPSERADFEPYLIISKEMGMTSVMWSINGKRLGVEELTRFARKLITHLVKVIKGEADSTESFSFSPNENRFEDPGSPDRSFEQIPDSDPGLHPGYQQPSIAETRSAMLKRLMEAAQQEEQEARNYVMAGVRQLTNRAATAPPESVAHAAVAQMSPPQQSLPKPPGALGSPGVPPQGAAPSMPTPPGAFGQLQSAAAPQAPPQMPTGGPPAGYQMPTPPGVVGSNLGSSTGSPPPFPGSVPGSSMGVSSGATPPFQSPPGGMGSQGGPPGGPPTAPSFPMPPGAFGGQQAQQSAAPQNPQNAPATPPITAPGGFGAALGALGSLVPAGQAPPSGGNELSRILDMPVSSETGPLPAQSAPQGPPPGQPESLGFPPPGAFGQPPRPAALSGAQAPGAPGAPQAPSHPQLPPGFGMPPGERAEQPTETNHDTAAQEEEPDGPPPAAPASAWDFSFSSGPAASASGPTPSLPPPPAPPPPAPVPVPPQMAPQMPPQAPPQVAPPVTPTISAPAPADDSANKGVTRGVSALFDEDDVDEPLGEIVETQPPQPQPAAPTGRGLAGLVRRDAAPKPAEPAQPAAEPPSEQRSRTLKDAVASAMRSAEDESHDAPAGRPKRSTLQSLFTDSGDQPVSMPEPKIQPVPSNLHLGAPPPSMQAPPGQLGLPVAQPGQAPPQAPAQQGQTISQQQAPPTPSQQAQTVSQQSPQNSPQPAPQAASPQVVFSSADPAELARQVDDAQKHAVDGCNRIVTELDNALKGLQEAGMRAMQEGNFETVTKVMEQANRLKGVRERMAQLTQEISSV